jgi:uncharacterized membrane protein YphA (DoxX/SURF4 family)
MNRISQTKHWAAGHSDLMPDLIRIYLGIGLMVKAFFFMSHGELVQQLLTGNEDSFFLRAAVAHYVIPVHLLGGLLLALGLATRIAALAQIPVLLGAILYLYLPKALFLEARQSLEFTALVLFLMVLIVLFGPGRISLDHYLFHRRRDPRIPEPAVA